MSHPKVAQARLGRATLSETMDTYAHLFQDTEDIRSLAVDKALAGALAEQRRTKRRPRLPVTEKLRVRAWAAGESACRPGSVRPLARAGGHPSRTAVAGSLMRSTREHRAGRPQSLAQERTAAGALPLDLAPGGVYRAAQVTLSAGGLLHRRFTLTPGVAEGGLFSVALSRGSPRVGVTDHPALWSPDLPRHARTPWRNATARPTRPPLLKRICADGVLRPWQWAGGPDIRWCRPPHRELCAAQ
jgi:hypothetical protein